MGKPSSDNLVLYGLLLLLAVAFIVGTWSKLFKGAIQADNFKTRAVRGVIKTIRHVHHGNCVLTVYNARTQAVDEFTLNISGFVKKHNIQIHDSIAKDANSRFASVYRKTNGQYQKMVDIDLWNTLE
jgi:hypothetical protein